MLTCWRCAFSSVLSRRTLGLVDLLYCSPKALSKIIICPIKGLSFYITTMANLTKIDIVNKKGSLWYHKSQTGSNKKTTTYPSFPVCWSISLDYTQTCSYYHWTKGFNLLSVYCSRWFDPALFFSPYTGQLWGSFEAKHIFPMSLTPFLLLFYSPSAD